MSSLLNRQSVSELIEYVDRNVQASGCDHSYRFSTAWAQQHSINWDDLRDALEASSAFCDCEVVLNLEDEPLAVTIIAPDPIEDAGNDWLVPLSFTADSDKTISKVIVSREGIGRNTHTKDGEWLVPAPADTKPPEAREKARAFFHWDRDGSAK